MVSCIRKLIPQLEFFYYTYFQAKPKEPAPIKEEIPSDTKRPAQEKMKIIKKGGGQGELQIAIRPNFANGLKFNGGRNNKGKRKAGRNKKK